MLTPSLTNKMNTGLHQPSSNMAMSTEDMLDTSVPVSGHETDMSSLAPEMSLPINMDVDLNGHVTRFDNGQATSTTQSGVPSAQQLSTQHQQLSTQHQQQQMFQHQQSQQSQSPLQEHQLAHRTSSDFQPGVGSGKILNNNMQNANNISSGVGAGPLPAGFGMNPAQNSGSTLTEFTKRRNWSQRVIEEIKDFLHILDANGRIMFVSSSTKPLTGFLPDDLIGKMMRDFIHPDDYALWMREFHESIASGNQLRFFYRFRKADNSYTIFECFGHPHLSSQAVQYGPSNPAGICRGFFMMARPYPTKNATLLDSFLEHKIENERLTKRIADLRKEEQEEIEQQNQQWEKSKQQSRPSMSEGRSDETLQTTTSGHSTDYNLMPPPSKPAISNLQLTQQNLDEANASSKPDSINDKMARYEGATHIETIEMLTGLRYRDGERSHGISTGDLSPSLVKGDAGIAMPIDRDGRSSDKKKKLKLADEYVCTDCGTLDSPEWRKGPSGPKTLCNACGLRWAKKEKKKQAPPHTHQPNQGQASMTSQASLSRDNSQGGS